MGRKRFPLDEDKLIELYGQGLTLAEIGTRLGCSRKVVGARLAERGLQTDRRRLPLDDAEIVRLYESGVTKHDIATMFGTWDMVISKRLAEHGHPTAINRSEAMRTRIARLAPAEREALVAPAHDAVRGMKRTDTDLTRRAIGKQRTGQFGSREEERLHAMLGGLGIATTPQYAFGKYNIDLVAGSVAVEISGRHRKPEHVPVYRKRIEEILDGGWFLVVVWANTRVPLTVEAANQVAALMEQASGDPSLIGQYRVIRGDGKLLATGSRESNDFPGILAPVSGTWTKS